MQSNKFRFTSRNLLDLIKSAPLNQNCCRLIAYMTDDPFSQETSNRNGDTMIQPDINFDDLLYKQFIIGQVDTTIITDLQVKVFLHPHRGRFPVDRASSEEIFCLSIVFPHIYNLLRSVGYLRPELIAAEFFENIDRANGTGVQKVLVTEYVEFPLDIQNFGCLNCFFTISNSNINP